MVSQFCFDVLDSIPNRCSFNGVLDSGAVLNDRDTIETLIPYMAFEVKPLPRLSGKPSAHLEMLTAGTLVCQRGGKAASAGHAAAVIARLPCPCSLSFTAAARPQGCASAAVPEFANAGSEDLSADPERPRYFAQL